MGEQILIKNIEHRDIEILVFGIDKYEFGINLAKVREIINNIKTKPVPYSHPVVEGVFELRNAILPLLDLKKWLEIDSQYLPSSKIIITDFLGLKIGFRVDLVERIYKIKFNDIVSPRQLKNFSDIILGTVTLNNRLINMIDYESIVLNINPQLLTPGEKKEVDGEKLHENRKNKNVWIIEDSLTVKDFLKTHLTKNGYENIIFFDNGKIAMETLVSIRSHFAKQGETDPVDLIITDIEMPVMDGYTFIQAIKADNTFEKIPVILFSSILSNENKLKGEVVKADAQLSKSDVDNIVNVMDRFIL